MRILTRYLLRAHLGPFLFALTVLTGLLLVNTVARRFEELAGKGLAPVVIGEVFLLSLPHIVALTLPMAVLVAVLYAFSQLAAENEMTALKASGVNPVRLLVPLLLAGTLLSLGMLTFNDRVLPETNHRLKNLLIDIGRKSPTLDLKEQVVNEIRTGDMRTRYFLRAARIDHATNRLWDVIIYDLSTPDRERTVYADSGRMGFNEDRTDLQLILYDGRIHELSQSEMRRFQRVYFGEYQIPLKGVGNQLERSENLNYRTDREMTLGMLKAAIQERQAELEGIRQEALEESLGMVRRALAGPAGSGVPDRSQAGEGRTGGRIPASVAGRSESVGQQRDGLTRRTSEQVRSLTGRARGVQGRINEFRVEYHKKYAIAFACLVFVLLGAPLALRFPRGGAGMVIAISLGIFGLYYVTLIGGESLGDDGKLSPFVAMWAANIGCLFFGLLGLRTMGQGDGSARGGGWDERLEKVRDAIARLFARPRRAGS